MRKSTTNSRDIQARPAATSPAGTGRNETTGPAQPAAGSVARLAEPQRDRIAQRAYGLYEQRGRQNGLALEDWLQAERQLAGAAGQS